MLHKKIILCITGSIAAYKSAMLLRLLKKEGAEVQVLMTSAAKEFITPLTLATLSEKLVIADFADKNSGSWHNHVELGLWADAIIIAPASANTIAKMANGICDNIVLATYLSARCTVFVAPAMDLDMWAHQSTQNNINKLAQYGNYILKPESGLLASGLSGQGRMQEPEQIIETLDTYFNFQQNKDFLEKNILITAGPTYEPIDPVRFIGNYSSGKMGIAIADELSRRGANVTIILGPTHLKPRQSKVDVINVSTAQEMHQNALQLFKNTDIAILSAAVADFRAKQPSGIKIKKLTADLMLELEENPDILVDLGKAKTSKQLVIGFALETNNAFENALAKLKRKNADAIILNSLEHTGAGFKEDTNQITIINAKGEMIDYELKTKIELAKDIADYIKNTFKIV